MLYGNNNCCPGSFCCTPLTILWGESLSHSVPLLHISLVSSHSNARSWVSRVVYTKRFGGLGQGRLWKLPSWTTGMQHQCATHTKDLRVTICPLQRSFWGGIVLLLYNWKKKFCLVTALWRTVMTPETRHANCTTRPVLAHFSLDLNPASHVNTGMHWSIPPIRL